MQRHARLRGFSIGFGFVLFAVSGGCATFPRGQSAPPREALPREITLAITDSGLGGLSSMAEAAARLKAAGAYERVNLVFVNALFDNAGGYNSLPDREAKIRVFDGVLAAIEREFRPARIYVACNTLSVLIPDLPFLRRSRTPVLGIVGAGVDMFSEALRSRPEAALLLFGTETTIAEGTHRAGLRGRDVADARIIPKACPELASYIENDWRGEDTGLLISSYVDEALARLPSPRTPVYVGLACTHFGYARELWKKAFAESKAVLAGILDPNARMAELIAPDGLPRRYPETRVAARVVSMVEIAENKRNSLGAWLERVSPEVAAALRSYTLKLGLFPGPAAGR